MDISDLYFALKHIWTCSCFILEFYIYQTSSSIVYWQLISVEHIYYLSVTNMRQNIKKKKLRKRVFKIMLLLLNISNHIIFIVYKVHNYRYVCNIEMRLIILR